MLQTVYVVRHGFRMTWETREKVWEDITGTPYDDPISSLGHEQAQEVAKYFLSLPEDEKPTAIFSSPTRRCFQTAAPTAKALNLPIFVEHGLSEWLMPVRPDTGLHPIYPATTKLKTLFYNDSHGIPISEEWSSVWIASRKGEDIEALHARLDGVVNALVHVLDNSGEHSRIGKHEHIAVFGHVAPLIAFIRAFIRSRIPIQMGVCSISTLKRLSENSGIGPGGEGAITTAAMVLPVKLISSWTVISLCSNSHLSGGESKPGGFEDPSWIFPSPEEFPCGVPGTELEEDWLSGCQVPAIVGGDENVTVYKISRYVGRQTCQR